ncbi:zinc ribbon protein [Lachnotalea glycerini]|uniref:Zinc ribbon protein n=1 Tax=Lachnotalea glycerini TaxID=1763509 RepID=A0A318EWY7_9FIRM|nr:tetratricopeptide repeat protein [Lachnotalea glycerini]PXV95757.1 zinc ribbon protein [Lachnotalea glycerini]
MVCTKCGAELKDTDLFCLNCGEEVRIVPDYSPVEELVIQNLAEAQQNEITFENAKEAISEKVIINKNTKKAKPKPKDKKPKTPNEKCNRKSNHSLSLMIAAFVILVIVVAVLWNLHKHSFEYQYNQAIKNVDSDNYAAAYDYLSDALKKDDSNINARLLMASVYLELGKTEEAISLLKETLKMDQTNEEAAKQLLEVYSEYNYTDELTEYSLQLKGTHLAEALGDFYENRPVFSIDGGIYDKYISVELTSKENSDIYYTVDGSKPNNSAIKYSGQIRLRGGTTQIRAVAINESGDLSLETIQEYTVNSTVPDNPVIKPASGVYSTPISINIIVPDKCKVYYTWDGTEPTEKSNLYSKPLDMPIGQHTLSVVAIDENGITSNTIQSNYDLEFETHFTVDQAYEIIIQRLGGELVDDKGAFDLECSSAIEIGGYNLYVFDKVYGTDDNGNKIYGTEKFTFDVLTAETFYTIRNAAGGYDLTPF